MHTSWKSKGPWGFGMFSWGRAPDQVGFGQVRFDQVGFDQVKFDQVDVKSRFEIRTMNTIWTKPLNIFEKPHSYFWATDSNQLKLFEKGVKPNLFNG